ncbi:hypothetical protein FACS1894166_06740 [Bacilli bacterium]|nr:hypothetical protein FACS1894166_06740 [Bacilli bacterium]
MAINTFVHKVGKIVAESATILKFIPIVVVVILGITFGSIHPGNNIFNAHNRVYGYDENAT